MTRNGVNIWCRKIDQREWVAACAGAGAGAATRAFAEIEKDGAVSQVVSVGWSGALNDELERGRTYWVSGVIDARTGERFPAENFADSVEVSQNPANPTDSGVLLVTASRVADEAEKRRLAAAYGADLVDMEAAAVARLALMRGIPFFCLKGVSDGLSDQLPDFNRFISDDGQFKLLLFTLSVLFRPWYWSALMRMGENSKKAAHGIRESMLKFLDRDTIKEL